PLAVQIFGSEPPLLAEAARMVVDAGADLVDINMGCPVKKVTKTGAGCTLLANGGEAAARIVEAVAGAVDVPVTVKMRTRAGAAQDAPRRARRLARRPDGRPAAGRGGRGGADPAPALGAADVHRHGRS